MCTKGKINWLNLSGFIKKNYVLNNSVDTLYIQFCKVGHFVLCLWFTAIPTDFNLMGGPCISRMYSPFCVVKLKRPPKVGKRRHPTCIHLLVSKFL